MLEWRQRTRVARLYKGGPPGCVPYQVLTEGVRRAEGAAAAAPEPVAASLARQRDEQAGAWAAQEPKRQHTGDS